MFGRRLSFRRHWCRRLVGLAVLISICASFFPLPVETTSSPEKDRSEPFPCQNRPCGCASAEQCWKQCCCFTNVEKVAWAKKNGVKLPEYVVRAAEAESADKVADTGEKPVKKCACCSTERSETTTEICGESFAETNNSSALACSTSDCCISDSGDQHQAESVCQHKETDSTPESAAESSSESSRYVIGIEMMKCRGQGLFWNSIPWAVIPIVRVPEFRVEPERWDRPQSAIAASQVADPPEPPPRLV